MEADHSSLALWRQTARTFTATTAVLSLVVALASSAMGRGGQWLDRAWVVLIAATVLGVGAMVVLSRLDRARPATPPPDREP